MADGIPSFDILAAAITPPPDPVASLTCEISDPCVCEIDLAWVLGGGYDEIRIYVDGVLVATLDGAETSAQILLPGPGPHGVCVVPIANEVIGEAACCSITCFSVDPIRPPI